MPNIGNRTVGQDPSAANVRDPQQKGDEVERSRGQDRHGKLVEPMNGVPGKTGDTEHAENSDDKGAND